MNKKWGTLFDPEERFATFSHISSARVALGSHQSEIQQLRWLVTGYASSWEFNEIFKYLDEAT